jgi:hypothetical protein
MTGPVISFIDLETSPHLADVWSLWKQNVSLNQLRESTRVISFANKLRGKTAVEFRSEFHDGHEAMIARAHEIIDQSDIVVHYNGESFDMPHLRREFFKYGMQPPSPVLQIDLLKTARRQFRFASNKLEYVSRYAGLEGKVKHEGHELWVKCMAGDPAAWGRMKRYNKRDVVVLEELYDKLLPWITGHPHMGLYNNPLGEDRCNKCAGVNLVRRGLKATSVGAYPQYRCKDCGGWSRGKKAVQLLDARGAE